MKTFLKHFQTYFRPPSEISILQLYSLLWTGQKYTTVKGSSVRKTNLGKELPLFHSVLFCVCVGVRVDPYKLRCGLSLSSEDNWTIGEALHSGSQGHVWPQKECINRVVISGSKRKHIHYTLKHTHTKKQANGHQEIRFNLFLCEY